MKKKLIIAYEYGYDNWYVSEFYKFFHSKLVDEFDIKDLITNTKHTKAQYLIGIT